MIFLRKSFPATHQPDGDIPLVSPPFRAGFISLGGGLVTLPRRAIERALLSALILVAFGLRLFRLANQSLWGDEMFSVYRAGQSLGEITRAVPDEKTLPPLYYYVLHLWVPLAGKSETAVRFLSLGFGTVAIGLLYVVVRRTVGSGPALVAALFATFSPFWIYYAQETRVYAQATALLLLALYLLFRAADEPRPRRARWLWTGYVGAATLALYSFYFVGFPLALGTGWVVLRRKGWPRTAVCCLLAQAVVLVLLSPLVIFAGRNMLGLASNVNRAATPLPTIFQHLEVAFSFGTTIDLGRVQPEVILSFGLALCGALVGARRGSFLWVLLLCGPILAIAYVSFVPQAGWERYFLVATPAWYALLGLGVAGLAGLTPPPGPLPGAERGGLATAAGVGHPLSAPGRGPGGGVRPVGRLALATLATLALIYGMALSLRDYYFDPAYWRPDFRTAVWRVDSVATPDVAVIVNGPPQFPSFFYYYDGAIPEMELPRASEDAGQTINWLNLLSFRYRGLWFVKYNPPDYDYGGVIENWLDTHAYYLSTAWVENTTFSLYLADDPGQPRVVAASAVGRAFGADAQLVSDRVAEQRAQNQDYLLVTLSWRALRTPPESLHVFAHLVDAQGTLLTQSDHEPVVNRRPAATWKPGDQLDDRFALQLPPPGQRQGLSLQVGLYRSDGTRLPIQGQDSPDNSFIIPLAGL
jgi:4-amino-4-deoxy-L-arabinose transferase-like glycosyltransferase